MNAATKTKARRMKVEPLSNGLVFVEPAVRLEDIIQQSSVNRIQYNQLPLYAYCKGATGKLIKLASPLVCHTRCVAFW